MIVPKNPFCWLPWPKNATKGNVNTATNMDKRVDNQKKWNQAKHDDCAQEPFLLITVAEERNQG